MIVGNALFTYYTVKVCGRLNHIEILHYESKKKKKSYDNPTSDDCRQQCAYIEYLKIALREEIVC